MRKSKHMIARIKAMRETKWYWSLPMYGAKTTGRGCDRCQRWQKTTYHVKHRIQLPKFSNTYPYGIPKHK